MAPPRLSRQVVLLIELRLAKAIAHPRLGRDHLVTEDLLLIVDGFAESPKLLRLG